MASWDWRPFVMLVFICVILIVLFSDVISHRSPISPTELPPLTLVLRTMTESPPINMALPVVLTYVEDSSLIPTNPPQSPTSDLLLDITPPHCYEMPHDGIQCLGLIYNPYDKALETVSLKMVLWSRNAELMDSTLFTLPQKYIPPYSVAPYQVIFSHEQIKSGDFGAVAVDFIHANLTAFTPHQITFEEDGFEWEAPIYRLFGAVQHEFDLLASVRLVVSLVDRDEQLLGFRVVELSPIAKGEAYPVQIDLMALGEDRVFEHFVYLEWIETNN